eukprot:834296-Rhodomonas_salina.2
MTLRLKRRGGYTKNRCRYSAKPTARNRYFCAICTACRKARVTARSKTRHRAPGTKCTGRVAKCI